MLTRLKAQLFLQTLRSAEQVPAQHLSQYTAGLVNQLICHAVASPFWRERLAMLVTHDGTISLDRWQEVPLLTDAEAHRVGAEGLAAHMGHEDDRRYRAVGRPVWATRQARLACRSLRLRAGARAAPHCAKCAARRHFGRAVP